MKNLMLSISKNQRLTNMFNGDEIVSDDTTVHTTPSASDSIVQNIGGGYSFPLNIPCVNRRGFQWDGIFSHRGRLICIGDRWEMVPDHTEDKQQRE